jgi:NTP pyrophosphatase (non-canonical NTP hydrolase)
MKQFTIQDIIATEQRIAESIGVIKAEYYKATDKHPEFAKTMSGAISILGEEFGEAAQAVNDHCTHGADIEKVRTELSHVAVVAIRTLVNLGELEAVL